MEAEEARAQQEGERDEEDPGVGMTACRLVGQIGERDAHGGRAEDQPEVAGVVLPEEVELGTAHEEPQPDEGEHQRDADCEPATLDHDQLIVSPGCGRPGRDPSIDEPAYREPHTVSVRARGLTGNGGRQVRPNAALMLGWNR